jgi:hypothetical protein
VGYLLIISLSVAVGVIVYRVTANDPVAEPDPKMWAGAAPAEQAPPGPPPPPQPPTNFERLSISSDRLTWHDRLVGGLGLVVTVALGAATLAFAIYLMGTTVFGLLKQAAEGPT